MPEEKARENRLRRMADRRGYRLVKSRRRDPGALEYGGYMLIKIENNFVACGQGNAGRGYAADLDEIEAFLKGEAA